MMNYPLRFHDPLHKRISWMKQRSKKYKPWLWKTVKATTTGRWQKGPCHPNIERSRAEYFAKKKEVEESMLEQMTERTMPSKHWKIQSRILCKEKRSRRKYARTKGPQVIHRRMGAGKGKGIARAPETGRRCRQPEIKEALSYMISVAVDALRLHFLREEVLGLRTIVLLLQRWTAVELGLCSTD